MACDTLRDVYESADENLSAAIAAETVAQAEADQAAADVQAAEAALTEANQLKEAADAELETATDNKNTAADQADAAYTNWIRCVKGETAPANTRRARKG